MIGVGVVWKAGSLNAQSKNCFSQHLWIGHSAGQKYHQHISLLIKATPGFTSLQQKSLKPSFRNIKNRRLVNHSPYSPATIVA